MRCSPTESDENTCSTCAHQVKSTCCCCDSTNNYWNIELVNKLLEVERFALCADMLCGNSCSANNEDIYACLDNRIMKFNGALW